MSVQEKWEIKMLQKRIRKELAIPILEAGCTALMVCVWWLTSAIERIIVFGRI